MKAQHLHRKTHVTAAILNSVNPDTFIPTRLTAKALNDDSCWDEYASDFEDQLPSHLLSGIDDIDFS